MNRSLVLSVAGALLALVLIAAYVVFGLVSPSREPDGEAGFEPDDLAAERSPAVLDDRAREVGGDAARIAMPAVVEERDTETLFGEIFVVGNLTSQSGAPIAKARVGAIPGEGEEEVVARTNPQGRFRLGPLDPGSRRLEVSVNGYYPKQVELELTGTKRIVPHDFRLEPCQRIAVHLVTSDGEPAPVYVPGTRLSTRRLGLMPVATRERPGDTVPFESRFSLRHGIGEFVRRNSRYDEERSPPYHGTVILREPAPAWLSLVAAGKVLDRWPVDRSTREVTFVVDPADLTALKCEVSATLVAAESGQPLVGQAWIEEDPFPAHQPALAGTDGFALFEQTSPTNRWFIARSPGRAETRRALDLAPGERLDLGTVPLSLPIELSGRAVDSKGEGVPVKLLWARLDPVSGKLQRELWHYAPCEADGSFTIADREPGIWVIYSPGLGENPRKYRHLAAPPVHVDASRGSVRGIEVVVWPTTAVTVLAPGDAHSTSRVEVFDPSGFMVSRSRLQGANPSAKLQLAPGEYELVLSLGGVEVHRCPLIVGTEPLRIELRY